VCWRYCFRSIVTAGPLLTAAELAERLQLTTDFVYRLVRRGEIPHLRFGQSGPEPRQSPVDLRTRSEAMGRR
jgi:excisionase family DNA binding protein